MKKSQLIKAAIIRFGLAIPVFGLFFFLPAGSLKYWAAWLYISIIFIPMIFVLIYFLRHDPSLLENRMKYKEKEAAQKKIISLSAIVYLIGFLIPGFDYRYNWSNIQNYIILIANFFVLLGYIFVFIVFKENSFASRIIEVKKNQKVISTGPYKIVRHPMYLGVLIMFMATPIALGSYYALIPFLTIPIVLVLRILNEEKLLLKELKGYKEYIKKTKYRLFPGIW